MARQLLSWRLTVCGLFLFACHALAASAVLGIDLGTEYIKAALVKPGIPLEIVLTKDSRRKETSAIAFKPPQSGPKPGVYPERAYGSDAMALAARFPGDVYPNLKTLLGLTVDSNSVVQEYAARHPALKVEAHKTRNTAVLRSSGAFVNSEGAWTVEELLAMELKSVRRNAEALAGPDTSVRSAVITVPPFYTTDEKRAVELAANLAGLRVLSLISDGLSVGLNYATSRQFPSVSDGAKPEINLVFDMGAGSTKATILKFQSRSVKAAGKFNKTVQEVEVLGSGWDRTLGGDSLNALIIDDMIAQFVDSPGAKAAAVTAEKVRAHGRTIAKLSKEAERVRHVLSANTNTAAGFEGLFEDVDFRYKISRADFEAMAAAHAERVNVAVQASLDMAGLKVNDLDSVILHGGATRTPFVQKQLELVFGGSQKLRTNVNSDESAVFGAGFRAAELSPSFRVKEIHVSEGAVYGVRMKPVGADNGPKILTEKQLWVPTSHLGAASEELTFSIGDDARAEQSVVFYQQVPGVDGKLVELPVQTFTTSNLSATVDKLAGKFSCEMNAMHFNLSIRLNSENGEVEVTKAVAGCESDSPEKESIIDGVKNLFGFGKNKDQEPLKEGEEAEAAADVSSESDTSTHTSGTSTSSSASDASSSQTSSTVSSAVGTASGESDPDTAGKRALVAVPIEFSLEKAGIRQLSDEELQKIKKRLQAFDASDRARLQREEIFNVLEGFTYRVRSLLESDDFVAVSTDKERATLEAMSSETSDWLYAGGVDATYDELKKKYTALKTPVDAIEARITEAEKRPELIKSLKEAMEQSHQFAQSIRDRIVEYEAFHASKSAAAEAAAESSTSTSAPSAETTASAPNAGESDFDGLEDDDNIVKLADRSTKDPLENLGPVPPMYTLGDLKETEDLITSTSAWLAEMEVAQAKLGPKDDPVLSVKDLEAKRAHLDKVGMELTMKAVRNFDKAQKKSSSGRPSKSKKTSKTKKKATTSTTTSSETSKPTQEGGKNEEIKHEEL